MVLERKRHLPTNQGIVRSIHKSAQRRTGRPPPLPHHRPLPSRLRQLHSFLTFFFIIYLYPLCCALLAGAGAGAGFNYIYLHHPGTPKTLPQTTTLPRTIYSCSLPYRSSSLLLVKTKEYRTINRPPPRLIRFRTARVRCSYIHDTLLASHVLSSPYRRLVREIKPRINMEVHAAPAAAAAKRAWSYLRAVFFMARKGVLSNKRKLFVSVHLLMKRRRNKQAVANLLSHHHHHHHRGNALRRRDYEFSCSNSPDVPPGSLFSFSHSGSRRRLAYFPCLGAVVSEKDEEEDVASSQPPLARIEYYAGASPPAPGEEYSAASTPAPGACFSVRVSNFSSEDEGAGSSDAVDDDAEEFIRRFYEQLRRQNQIAMLPYHLQESSA